MKHKILATLLAASMLTALAACGSRDAEGSPNPSGSPPSTVQPDNSPEQPSHSPAQSGDVDLQAFYEGLFDKYEDFNADMPVEGEFLDAFYPGMSEIETKQQVIYQPMMSGVVCEIALVEVENAADVDAVKDIFQARIDYQVGTDDAPGGAYYPESIEGWKNSSRIVSNGNCVMMVAVWEYCDDIAADFNALF